MKRAGGLVDDISSRVRQSKPGYKPWNEKLPQDVQAELAEVKRRFRAGEIAATKVGLAKAIGDAIEGRGFLRPGVQAVVAWLKAE